ncbi:3-deoxy-7-phosphoheptulonate synthase [Sediminispirochaeta smaragdinae]|uniref:Phospho-2-dehydro-3-deoxyheptonate aldolase n=1 Tax=Sediminispirochaeta smaragdinae (strain DSM 11293 / JCM 15392 / SEBR 4228) TaxID=573413 RepID=E1R732_SEDSS|nr:3-deoxy-7-phosphoheptulonate synthase [Sediminispirochaeta smaragdinae]ADK81359.1 phospho-2-dehydro-3-deoxyheptonate aldolase [Sediminispirochaeta smaragdinae DSM 11293]
MNENDQRINDLHIRSTVPLISPKELKREYPLTPAIANTVIESRRIIKNIITGKDKRLLAIVGPCSIHDRNVAIDYAKRLKELADEVSDSIYVVMRVYFEKPRTTIGWRGLIVDPYLDGSYDIAYGLKLARQILLDIVSMGLPAGSEMLDPIVPQYIDDLVSWAAIGARTTESQTHRNLASGLSMPVGFKNGTSGSLELAVNAMQSAEHPASFIGIDQDGNTCILHTTGHDVCHLILRGGRSGPNYHEEDVEHAQRLLEEAGLLQAVFVDCSHANSGKRQVRQRRVLRSVIDQIVRGQDVIRGVMIESNIDEGCQDISDSPDELKYGISITDECVGWEETEDMLRTARKRLKEAH